VIVKFTGNKPEDQLALKQESLGSTNDEDNEVVATDSATLSRDSQGEPAKSQAATPSERDSQTEESKQAADGSAPSPTTATADEISPADKTKDDERLAESAEADKEQPVQNAPAEAEKEVAQKKQAEEFDLDDNEQKQRVATATPESRAKAPGGATTSKVIRGRVESADGIPLPGVNVMFKNTNIGTVTDASGNYQLSVADDNPSLVFSFIGFTSTEVDAGDNTQLNVQLSEDVSQLSEIVVVGYGSEKKSEDAPETLEFANPYGGRRAYKQYLEKNIHYPEQALAQNIEGKVTIQFTVEPSGQLSDFRVLKGLGHGCEEEVIRLVKQGPKWNPTRRNTESLRDKVKVRMKFTLPKK
jgi:TonB family protein